MEHVAAEMTWIPRKGESKTDTRRKLRLRLVKKGHWCLLQNKNTRREGVGGRIEHSHGFLASGDSCPELSPSEVSPGYLRVGVTCIEVVKSTPVLIKDRETNPAPPH